jgi:hypothetical protein
MSNDMKTKLTILTIMLGCNLFLSQAQYQYPSYLYSITVYTPKSTSVNGGIWSEYGSYWIDLMSQDALTNYPNADYLDSPTATYNCHSYAWNMTEDGETCWINVGNSSSLAYANDGSYVTTGWGSTEKIFYNSDDHSAIKVSGYYVISKWGSGPLMGHDVLYGPYTSMQDQICYKLNRRGGASTVPSGFAYPIPVDNILIVDLDVFAATNPTLYSGALILFEAHLYDRNGNRLLQQKAGRGIIQFDVSNFPNGLYFLHIYDGVNSVPVTEKILVHH